MRRKVVPFLLALSLCLGMLPAQALAAEGEPEEVLPIEDVIPPVEQTPPTEEVPPVGDVTTDAVLLEGTPASGTWETLTWALDGAGTLTITGTGSMPNTSAPWSQNRASVKEVIIGAGVTTVGNGAFSGCKSLTGVTIPAGVTSIGSSAFRECTSLTSVTIPAGVTSIGGSAFSGCKALTSVTIPGSVTAIDNDAFYYCSSLTSVAIPAGVTVIKSGVFSRCSSLTSVTIPEGVTTISGYAFSYCSSLKSVTIPGSVTAIYDKAFSHCSSLTSVTIPDSVKYVYEEAFSYCTGLTSVTIPASVISFGSGVFSNCSALTSTTIEEGATTIGEYLFRNCTSLTDVTIPGSVTSIRSYAFSNCSALTSVTIPASVTTIYNGAFSGCSGLTSVTIPDSVTSMGESVFSGCSGLTSVTIPDSVTSISTGTFTRCSGLTSVTIPDSVTIIGSDAFSYCSGLTSVTIPDSVTAIRARAFSGCSGLTSVEIPDSVTSMGESAFSSCTGLTSVKIPQSVTNIGGGAFSRCSGLTSVTIPASVTIIGSDVFSDCSALTSVKIPQSVTNIGSSAFARCTGLTEVWILGSETLLGSGVFKDCTNLADIYYAGSLEQWKSMIEVYNKYSPPETAKIHPNTGEIALTVTLDPNGGQLSSGEKYIAAVVGTPCGALPTPTRYEHIFTGWFTAAEGGERVTEATIVTEEDAGRTLYAHWSFDWLEKMTYSFGNASGYFGYEEHYKIPYERYAAIFGDTPRAKELYEASEEWGGNCFGMSTTSAMFSQKGSGSDVLVSAFQRGASRPYDLAVSDTNGAWNLTLREFIETMQISQESERINRRWSDNSLDELCAQARTFQQSGKAPPLVSIRGSLGESVGGHAMLIYDLIDISPTESRLMVYDPNYPDQERYIRLDRTNGAYIGWYYHMNDEWHWGTGYPNAAIAYLPYSDFYGVWTEKPGTYGQQDRAAALASAGEESALLIFNSDNATILDAKGNQIAAVENGQLKTSRTDIFPMMLTDVPADGTAAGSENTILFLPPDLYTIEDNSGAGQDFKATMVHMEQSATVTTSGSSVTFAVDDGCELNYARVNGPEPGKYTITLESSLLERPEESPGTFHTVAASGSLDGKGASAAQVAGELFAENVPAENIQVNGGPVSTEDLGDGGKLDISDVLDPGITAALQEDGSVLLSSSPSGVAHVYAASYDSNERMTQLTAGTLDGSTIRFSKPVAEGVRIFLLDDKYAPVSGNIVIKKQVQP